MSIIKVRHEDTNETVTYKLKFIDTLRFMRDSLATRVDNFSEINHKECKTCLEKKKS